MNQTSLTELLAARRQRDHFVVVNEMPADLETPVSAFLKLRDQGARVLLESVESGTVVGRFSFICLQPEAKVTLTPQELVITDASGTTATAYGSEENPLMIFKQLHQQLQINAPDGGGGGTHPPLLGGAVGYFGYEFARFFEKLPDRNKDSLGLPPALLYLIDTLLVFDHVQRRLKVMTLAERPDDPAAREKLAQIMHRLKEPLEIITPGNGDPAAALQSNMTKAEFCAAVLRAQEHIAAGDVFQLVLSQRLAGQTTADPFMIYRALRMLNPSPYMFFLDFDEVQLIGSSPEALVRLTGRQATVRPIAGTRPRGKTEEEDKDLSERLLADEKERAEHVMLVDLGRNDLGRCCEFGTVRVTDFMNVERYSHVMHITSNVTGLLREPQDQFDLFRATFPAGTVTGAPKIKAMTLIEELENIKRGPYAGAVGYFSLSGDTDWCITIRTIVMQGERFYLQAGAGIVADSVPEREYQETRDKLAALSQAIKLAEGGF